MILEKKARKEARAAYKQERDPFVHYLGLSNVKVENQEE